MERMGLNDMYLGAMLTPILSCEWIPYFRKQTKANFNGISRNRAGTKSGP